MGFWSSNNKSEDKTKEGETLMSEKTVIDFGEVLDISFAAKFHSQLKDDVSPNSTVSFVSHEITRLDASCLQVIASFVKYAEENEIIIHWDNPSETVMEAARLTGLTASLALQN